MKQDRNIFLALANQIDLLNTINGGTSMTSVQEYKDGDNHVIEVNTPGLHKNGYHVEVINNHILIYSLIKIDKSEEQIHVPSFIRYFPVPWSAKLNEVYALHEEGILKVVVPLNGDQNQNKRKIDINYL